MKSNHDYMSPMGIFIKYIPENVESVLKDLQVEIHASADFENAENTMSIGVGNEWTTILDDWSFSLYYHATIRDNLKLLAQKHDMFYYTLGDIDQSYSITLYEDGILVRDFEVIYPNLITPKVIKDIGNKLPGEITEDFPHEPLDMILNIAKLQGIPIIDFSEDITSFNIKGGNIGDTLQSGS